MEVSQVFEGRWQDGMLFEIGCYRLNRVLKGLAAGCSRRLDLERLAAIVSCCICRAVAIRFLELKECAKIRGGREIR